MGSRPTWYCGIDGSILTPAILDFTSVSLCPNYPQSRIPSLRIIFESVNRFHYTQKNGVPIASAIYQPNFTYDFFPTYIALAERNFQARLPLSFSITPNRTGKTFSFSASILITYITNRVYENVPNGRTARVIDSLENRTHVNNAIIFLFGAESRSTLTILLWWRRFARLLQTRA